MATAWAVVKYLDHDGYLRLAREVLEARDRIYRGLLGLGFRPTAPIESSILSLHIDEESLFRFIANMSLWGWFL
jgi:glutamate/tyrosine decarboxylase-like PLP-dependent enzyme